MILRLNANENKDQFSPTRGGVVVLVGAVVVIVGITLIGEQVCSGLNKTTLVVGGNDFKRLTSYKFKRIINCLIEFVLYLLCGGLRSWSRFFKKDGAGANF